MRARGDRGARGEEGRRTAGPLRRSPLTPAFAFLEHAGPIAFAHRGGGGEHPENTLAAFGAAVALGYRYVETDVHATRDGVLVAFHDDRLDRVTDRTGPIGALPFAEVARARVAGREPIARFEELLGSWPDLRVNVEPKSDAAVEPLVAAIRRTGALERVCVGSFAGSRVARVRAALGPRLATALRPAGVVALRAASIGPGRVRPLARLARVAAREGAACVQVPASAGPVRVVDRAFVDAARRLGLPVHVWTVDEPAEMHRLLEIGVDGLMSDRPVVLREVLVERGAWAATMHG